MKEIIEKRLPGNQGSLGIDSGNLLVYEHNIAFIYTPKLYSDNIKKKPRNYPLHNAIGRNIKE